MHWRILLLVVVGAHLAFLLFRASHAEALADGDTCCYYSVARNVALGRGLTDTVRWEFLGRPAAVVRPAGDYWAAGWPLLLGTVMRFAGTGPHVAMACCAVLAATLPVLVFWLCHQLLPADLGERRAAFGVAAAVLVCCQDRLWLFEFMPDVETSYLVFTLLGMGMALRAQALGRRWAMVVAAAALTMPLAMRADGFVPLLAFMTAGWLRRELPLIQRWRAFLWTALGAGLVALPLHVYNLVAFGALEPRARSLTPWMTSYNDLFCYASQPSPERFLQQGAGVILQTMGSALWADVSSLVSDVSWILVVCAVLGMMVSLRQQPTVARPLALLCLFFLLVPCIVAPHVAGPYRFECHSLPVLCVFCMPAFALIRQRALASLLFLGCILVHWPFPHVAQYDSSGWTRKPACLSDPTLATRLRLSPEDVVLTDMPWETAALLDVGTVIPSGDPDPGVVAQVIDRYRPRFMMIEEGHRLAAYRAVTGLAGLPLVPRLESGGAVWYEFTYK